MRPGSAPCFAVVAFVLLTIGIGWAPATASGAPVRGYAIRDLGTLPAGSAASPTSINDKGQVVGWSYVNPAASAYHPFVWTEKTGMRDLGTFGGPSGAATSTNFRGQVVGSAQMPDEGFHAFLWEEGVGLRDLAPLIGAGRHSFANGINSKRVVGGQGTSARAINDSGLVVGSAVGSWGTPHAVLWRNGTITDLGDIYPQRYSEATGINNQGQVVGNAYGVEPYDTSRHAFVWDSVKGLRPLGGFSGGTDSMASGINDDGLVVGTAHTSTGEWHASVWQEGVGLRDLGTLAATSRSWATAINGRGGIAGASSGGSLLLGGNVVLWTPSR